LGEAVIGALRRTVDNFLGRGEAAVTVPVMDGPLKPNQLLESASRVLTAPGLDNLAATPDGIVFTSGNTLNNIPGGEIARFPSVASCLAADAGGALAIGFDDGGVVIRGGAHDGRRFDQLNFDQLNFDQFNGNALNCPTAAVFLDADTLIGTNGSSKHRPSQWRRDLMTLGTSGAVWRLDLAHGTAQKLASGLAWPCGIAAAPDGRLFVSESWRHQVLLIDAAKASRPELALTDPPAYPGRIAPAAKGGYWLTFFSVRNQLIEFILREKEYRLRMIEEVPEPFWMAPALASTGKFEEPLQGSGLKQMGILKPWAATRSYGLVVRCDAAMQPMFSYHSRADGVIHGITSVCEDRADLLVAAKGPGVLVRLAGAAERPVGTRPA
jgi:sugar lactone lactonase YvrE